MARAVKQILQRYKDLQDIIAILGIDELSRGGQGQSVARARKIQRFLSQPFHVAEQFTGIPGKYVPLKDTIRSFKMIVNGELDHLPEQAFYMVGADRGRARAGQDAAEVARDGRAWRCRRKLTLEVVTPEGLLLREPVDEVIAPGRGGLLRRAARPHAVPVDARAGRAISYRRQGAWHRLTCFWGFCEVLPDRVNVLAEHGRARRATSTSARAEDGRARAAEAQLKAIRDEAGYERGAPGLRPRAVTRLAVARKHRTRGAAALTRLPRARDSACVRSVVSDEGRDLPQHPRTLLRYRPLDPEPGRRASSRPATAAACSASCGASSTRCCCCSPTALVFTVMLPVQAAGHRWSPTSCSCSAASCPGPGSRPRSRSPRAC